MASSVTLEEMAGSEGSSNRSMLTFSVGTKLERKNQVQDYEKSTKVAMISCAILAAENDDTFLRFSTFNSDRATLDQFSKLVPDHKVFLLSACLNLLLITSNPTFLCNIATREMITLPNTPGNDGSCGIIGFGYIPSTKEFKVFADLSFGGSGFKVLTLGVNRWGDVEDPPFYVEGYGNAFVNGAID